jgi:hypothetical protein
VSGDFDETRNDYIEKELLKAHFEIEQLKKQQKLYLSINDTKMSTEEIYFQFAKSTFLYYLTANDNNQKSQHLKTLLDLFRYDESQLAKIKQSTQRRDSDI